MRGVHYLAINQNSLDDIYETSPYWVGIQREARFIDGIHDDRDRWPDDRAMAIEVHWVLFKDGPPASAPFPMEKEFHLDPNAETQIVLTFFGWSGPAPPRYHQYSDDEEAGKCLPTASAFDQNCVPAGEYSLPLDQTMLMEGGERKMVRQGDREVEVGVWHYAVVVRFQGHGLEIVACFHQDGRRSTEDELMADPTRIQARFVVRPSLEEDKWT